MTVLPVVERELRVASRRWQTYWGRTAGALAATLIAAYGLIFGVLSTPGGQSAYTGSTMFWIVSGFAALFAMLAGVSYTADSISSERREGTLGLLFLTDLSGADVAFGKLTAHSLGAFYGLMAVVPVMAITFLLGGVNAGEYTRMTLLLVVCLSTALSLGLLASTFATGNRNASMLAFLLAVTLVMFFPLLGPSLDWVLERIHWQAENTDVWMHRVSYITPTVAFVRCGDAAYQAAPKEYWTAISVTATAGLTAFLLAIWRLPRTWQDKPHQHSQRKEGILKTMFQYANERRLQLLERSPVAWLGVRHANRRFFPWLLLSGGAIIFASIAWHDQTIVRDAWWFFFITGLIQLSLKFWLAGDASRQLLEDRRSGAIELQVVSPLSTADLINGHLIGVWKVALYPVLTLLFCDLLLVIYASGFSEFAGASRDSQQFLILWTVREILFVVDLFALAWASMQAGMVSPNARAARGVISKVLLLPWLITAVAIPIAMAATFRYSGPTSDSTGFLAIMAWGLLCLANDAFWALKARHELMTQFRERATRPLMAHGGWSPLRIFKRV